MSLQHNQKLFSLYKFPSKHFSVWGKNICIAPFLNVQELHSWSTLKASVCIFLCISVKECLLQKRSKIVSGCGWGKEWRGWIISLRWLAVWTSQNVVQFFILIQIFGNSTIFHCFVTSVFPSIALKRWNFLGNLAFKGKILAKFLIRIHFLSI